MKGLLAQGKILVILLSDVIMAFLALSLMLLLRYGSTDFEVQLATHLLPFTVIISLFLLIFYVFNLYSFRFNRNITEFTNSFIKSLSVSFAFAVLVFYTFGHFFQLTPKTNLVIFTALFGALDFYFRILLKRYFVKKKVNRRVVIVDQRDTEDALLQELEHNQNIGYEILQKVNNLDLKLISDLNPDLVVLNTVDEKDFDQIYPLIKQGVSVYTVNNFYEEIFQKVPTEKVGKEEIVEYLSKNRAVFNFLKRGLDLVLSTVLIIILSPLFLIMPVLVKLSSSGPVFFKHKRMSQNDTIFTIYKFRSMYEDAEKNGAVWTASNKSDARITPLGRFMRETHIDEIPQLWNILRGDLSFVGPRPERPEFINSLKQEILYYDLRHAVKAGLTGWAQVNYKYGASIDDAREKLKYDFYYIKNRTIFFDILIILKTVAKLFSY